MTKKTSGRCRSTRCGDVVYTWASGTGRRLKHAKCPRCGNWLKQTCLALLCSAGTVYSTTEPVFSPIARLR